MDFLEATLLLLPTEAGGRSRPIWPREGTYRPWLRRAGGGAAQRVRLIEGPPQIAPGSAGLVVIELESPLAGPLGRGEELELVEQTDAIGFVTVMRLWRSAIAV